MKEEEKRNEERLKAKKKEEETRRAEVKKKEAERQRAEEGKKKAEIKESRKGHAKGKGKATPDEEEEDQAEEEEEGEEEEEEESASRKPGEVDVALNKYFSSDAHDVLAPRIYRRKSLKTPTMINDAGKNISNDLVSGAMYPSCLACANAKKLCQWKQSTIHLRLSRLPNKARNCEECIRTKDGCHFIWEGSKRSAESAIEPQSPTKKVKTESPDLVAALERIDDRIGALIKLTTAQAQQSAKDHRFNTDMFETVTDSLEMLHEKANGA